MASHTSRMLFRENVSHDKIPTPTRVDSKRLQRNEFDVFYFSFQISCPYYALHHPRTYSIYVLASPYLDSYIYSYGAMYKIHHPTDNQICAIFADNPDYFHRCMVDQDPSRKQTTVYQLRTIPMHLLLHHVLFQATNLNDK